MFQYMQDSRQHIFKDLHAIWYNFFPITQQRCVFVFETQCYQV